MDTLVVVLASAGTAAFVTGVMTLVGQHFERRSKRRDLLLAKAVQVAAIRVELMIKTAENNQQAALIPDFPYLTEKYYQSFAYLMDHGKLSPEAKSKYDESYARLRAKDEERG